MRKLFALLTVSMVVMGGLAALGETSTKRGILLDARCSGRAEKAAQHKKSCSLMPACKESGYGIVVDGQFLKFDQAGDEKALALLEATSKSENIQVEVTGDFDSTPVKVEDIREVDSQ